MTPKRAVFQIRELYWPTDREQVRNFDTSFATTHRFAIERGPLSLALREVPCHRFSKAYPLNLDEGVIKHALLAVAICAGDVIAGFAVVKGAAWNRRAVLTDFYVDPAFRRRSAGQQLMTHVVNELRGTAWRQLWLETQNVNHPAILFYQKMGFRICGFDLIMYAEPLEAETAVFMSLDLKA